MVVSRPQKCYNLPMQIHYFGLSSFKITTKDATVITDPFDKESGLLSPRGAADIIILSEKNNKLYTATSGISGEPFLISDPGEYDVKGVTVTGIPLKQDDGDGKSHKDRYVTAILIESEDIRILNLAHIREFSMKEADVESLGEIDILILPVGGNSVLTAKDASKIVHEIEPKIVIPSHYSTEGLTLPYEKVDGFIKELGAKPESMEKLIIKKKDLEPEKTKVVTLEPLR
jgi:L-ascorbate metabolism protein UlaG (beta-lactamase superfamily)